MLEKLNPYQKEAVLDESRACIVNANVGSGKTTVLIAKLLYLHHEKNVPYRNMIVLTFTNKAANEIKERLQEAEPDIAGEDLVGFGTFHSVALQLLRTRLPLETLGFSNGFLVITPDEEIDLALQIIRGDKLKIKYKNRLKKRLEQRKAAKYQDDFPILLERLTEEKKKQDKMSFSDLIYYADLLLKETPLKPDWIIVDEVQDSDRRQLDFIETLMEEETHLFAVGDPNQVIYSWRGSELNVVYTLKHRYDAKELTLPINYRSSGFILQAAKKFQQNGADLTGAREEGSKIVVKNYYDSFQAAEYLADTVEELRGQGIPYQEIAVFYRLQDQSAVFEKVFARRQIPCEVSLRRTVADIPVLNWLVKVLCFSANPRDISSGVLALSDKVYGEGLTAKKAAEAVNNGTGSGLLEKMQGISKESGLFASVEDLYGILEIDKYIRPTSSSYEQDKDAVQRFLRAAEEYRKRNGLPRLEGIREFINSSALYGTNLYGDESGEDKDAVRLMTLHAAKGLEFSYVFITGVNQGLIPLQARSFEEEEEERRLFFVGMTRAKDHLELSWYTDPGEYRAAPGPGRYIKMLPPHLVQDDTVESSRVDLQELKKQVVEEQKKARMAAGQAEPLEDMHEPVPKMKHAKYGVGSVVSEDDMMIEVEFDGYGRKEFVKAFSELEVVED